ncbi:23S rRNA pseudouridine(1911/1915/1917) synthase RluD [Aurantivibrio infirmus]
MSDSRALFHSYRANAPEKRDSSETALSAKTPINSYVSMSNLATKKAIHHVAIVPAEFFGQRFDQAASSLFPEYSRAKIQQWIRAGDLLLDGKSEKPKSKLLGGEKLELNAEELAQGDWLPEDITLDIVFEDEHILVLNKPADLVVHPGAGNWDGTLLNALLFHLPEQIKLPRAGIVHRLDKDTTGLMVVAKSLQSHQHLVSQLQERSVGREYEAIVSGTLKPAQGSVSTQIGRHSQQRKKMAVVKNAGKLAITHYQTLRQFSDHSHIELKLETGRTHQIRVHMSHLGHPLVGDSSYGYRKPSPQSKVARNCSAALFECLTEFPRQALHAKRLRLNHPQSGDSMSWEAELPADLQTLLDALAESEDFDLDES